MWICVQYCWACSGYRCLLPPAPNVSGSQMKTLVYFPSQAWPCDANSGLELKNIRKEIVVRCFSVVWSSSAAWLLMCSSQQIWEISKMSHSLATCISMSEYWFRHFKRSLTSSGCSLVRNMTRLFLVILVFLDTRGSKSNILVWRRYEHKNTVLFSSRLFSQP